MAWDHQSLQEANSGELIEQETCNYEVKEFAEQNKLLVAEQKAKQYLAKEVLCQSIYWSLLHADQHKQQLTA